MAGEWGSASGAVSEEYEPPTLVYHGTIVDRTAGGVTAEIHLSLNVNLPTQPLTSPLPPL